MCHFNVLVKASQECLYTVVICDSFWFAAAQDVVAKVIWYSVYLQLL